jgi:rhodanese-related sulfurtransferase
LLKNRRKNVCLRGPSTGDESRVNDENRERSITICFVRNDNRAAKKFCQSTELRILIESIAVTELALLLEQPNQANSGPLILDVRETWEVETARFAGAMPLPMSELLNRLHEVPKDRPIAVLCHHGVRSMQVAQYLERQGYGPLYNIQGGIDAWSRQVDNTVPTY